MSRVTPMQTAYNGGELSPFMLGRPDHAIWPVALAEMVGWAPRPQGAAETCPGFEYIETAAGECRLIPFEPHVTQGYVIEASVGQFRFYTNDVLLRDGGGDPVTVAHPYTLQQLKELTWEQSDDVLYLFHGAVQTRQLVRTAADAFELDLAPMANGPFGNRNDDETITLSFSGVSGAGVTVTATEALFAATDVGRLIEIEAHDLSNIPSWEPGVTVAIGQLRQWDGRVYQCTGAGAAGRTGSVAPVHVRGAEWDGMGTGTDLNDKAAGGVQWTYLFDMYGRLKITGYTSATVVTATVTRHLPLQVASVYDTSAYIPSWYDPDPTYAGGAFVAPGDSSYTPGTWRWRLGAFSDTTGWPSCGVVWNQRLVLGMNDTLYGSVAGDLTDYDRLNEYGDVSIDQAFIEQLDAPDAIRWVQAPGEFFIGTEKAEYVMRAASAAQPFGPGNIDVKRQSRKGSAAVRPLQIDDKPVFLNRTRRVAHAMLDDTYGKFKPEDLTRYADHIGNSPFVELCSQMQPLSLHWGVREDGTLACANYVPDEQVLGWFRRPLPTGFTAESICPITSPDGLYDQLWVSAAYGGNRFVMLLDEWRLAGVLPDLPIVLDAALAYSGAPATTFTLPHLPNTDVQVVADGAWIGTKRTDDAGQFTISAASKVVAGLPFDAYLVFLPFEGGGDNGPAQGRMKRCNRVSFRVANALGLQVTCAGADDDSPRYKHEIGGVMPGAALDTALPPITKDWPVDVVGGWDRAGQLRLDRIGPFHSSLLAHMPTFESEQR